MQIPKDKDYLVSARLEEENPSTRLKQNEQDGLDAIEREAIYPERTHWHSARAFPQFNIIKVLDPQGSWNGLYSIESKNGLPLPPELKGHFYTDPTQAITAIQNYLIARKKNEEKETTTKTDA
jgi:hypothetical protein